MKKWMIAMSLLALILAETGCVVRVKERSRPYPTQPPRRVAAGE